MADEAFDLADDAKRALREGENFAWRSNVAILAPEHLLAGALFVVAPSLPDGDTIQDSLKRTVEATQGSGSDTLKDNVMFGSAARAALSYAVTTAQARGTVRLSAAELAASVIDSGEISPMFWMTLDADRDSLKRQLAIIAGIDVG